MRKFITAGLAAATLATIGLTTAVPASAQMSAAAPAITAAGHAAGQFEQVRWHGRRGHHRGHSRYYGHRHYGHGAAVGAGIVGLAAGAILGSAIAAGERPPTVIRDGSWIRACSAKYRSFDPRTGTYLGYDGYRHYCQL
jgi:hypothetical protein